MLDTAPSQVKVQVQNGSGATGLAGQVSADLTRRGFGVVGAGDASTFSYTTSVIEYATPADLAAVSTLKAQLTSVKVVQDGSLTPGTITLIVGSTFSGLKPTSAKPATTTASTPSVSKLSSSLGAITANTGICKDQAAFAGPNGG